MFRLLLGYVQRDIFSLNPNIAGVCGIWTSIFKFKINDF
jgi:hypothetical protein